MLPFEISCLTYNIHKGFTRNNRNYVLQLMRDAIRETDCEIVAVQEVLGEHQHHARKLSDWHHEAHFEFLADQVWPHCRYGKNAIYQHGHHGNALLSKYPFHNVQNQNLTQWKFSQRGLLYGQVKISSQSSRPLWVACVHMGFLPYEQGRQTQKIIHWLNSLPANDPVLLMGDMNDWHQQTHRHLKQYCQMQEVIESHHGKLQPTYPATRPFMSMDRIYFRNLQLTESCVLKGAPWHSLSDHCPVLAKFLLD